MRVGRGDGRRYTIVVKDVIPGKRPDGRDESGLSWEWDFIAPGGDGGNAEGEGVATLVGVRWGDLRPTYRGREVENPPKLNLGGVKRLSIMIRR